MPLTIVPKPWGQETILTNSNLPYCGKIIKLNQGKRWSTQVHDQKTETLYCVAGQAKLFTGPDLDNLTDTIMAPDQSYTIPPGTVHRVEALTEVTIFEICTPEIGTTTRLQDDYGRPDETETVRNLPNRGWTNQ